MHLWWLRLLFAKDDHLVADLQVINQGCLAGGHICIDLGDDALFIGGRLGTASCMTQEARAASSWPFRSLMSGMVPATASGVVSHLRCTFSLGRSLPGSWPSGLAALGEHEPQFVEALAQLLNGVRVGAS